MATQCARKFSKIYCMAKIWGIVHGLSPFVSLHSALLISTLLMILCSSLFFLFSPALHFNCSLSECFCNTSLKRISNGARRLYREGRNVGYVYILCPHPSLVTLSGGEINSKIMRWQTMKNFFKFPKQVFQLKVIIICREFLTYNE